MSSFFARLLRSIRAQWPYYLCLVALIILCRGLWKNGPKSPAKSLAAIAQAHAKGEPARVEDYVHAWLPQVARVESYFFIALLLAGPWLLGDEPGRPVAKAVDSRSRRALWLVTGVTIATSAWLNHPRLSHSFWADEEYTARRLIVGEFRPDADGTSAFHSPSWLKTLFFYHDPNNHPLFSALARLSHSLVARPQGAQDFYFTEWAIRLPAFVFGLGGIAAVAWLAALAGLPRAGMVAVIWLALHPWLVRYGVDARGYALVLGLLPLCMALLWRAVTTGGMSWWLAFGLAEFLLLWSYPGTLYFLLLLNLAACGMLLTASAATSRGLQWRRYAVSSVIGGLLAVLLLAPCVQPMKIFLKSERIRGNLDAVWLAEAASGLFTGLPWAKWADHELALAWMRVWDQSPSLVVVTLAALALLLVVGTVALWRAGPLHRWLWGAVLLTGPFMAGMAKAQGNILYAWYFIVSLPGLAVLYGAGIEQVAAWMPWRGLRLATPAILLAAFGAITWPQCRLLREHPIEPMRESVAVTRPERNPFTADLDKVLTARLCMPARIYDPAAVEVEKPAELRALMQQADATQRPLYVNFGYKWMLSLRDPEMLALLDDPAQFEELPMFPGIHGQPERRVYRYRGKPHS